MAQFNVHEAKTHFSILLDLVVEGEEILITRNGTPVAELVPARQRGLVLGAGQHDANINRDLVVRTDWWKPMSDKEVEAFLNGQL
jgi:prevent-host-death family protein